MPSNAIPILEGTDASGGYLVHPSWGPLFQDAVLRESAVWQLARLRRVSGKSENYDIYSGRPTVAWVTEGGAKPVSGASFNRITVNVHKLTSLVVYTEEMLADAVQDPRSLVSSDVTKALAYEIDAQVLGYRDETALTGGGLIFDTSLPATTQSVQLGTGPDAFATAISAAIGKVEANGYRVNGMGAGWKLRQYLRDQRGSGANATVPVFTEGYTREPDNIYGIPISYSSHLTGYATSGAKVVAVVGDFNEAVGAMREDVVLRTSDQASLVLPDTTVVGLWQQNEVAALWETRVGFQVHDLSKAFCKIVNAT